MGVLEVLGLHRPSAEVLMDDDAVALGSEGGPVDPRDVEGDALGVLRLREARENAGLGVEVESADRVMRAYDGPLVAGNVDDAGHRHDFV